MSAVDTEIIGEGPEQVTLNVFHDLSAANAHQFIVQIIKERWGGFSAKVLVKGFEISASGAIRELVESELYDYT